MCSRAAVPSSVSGETEWCCCLLPCSSAGPSLPFLRVRPPVCLGTWERWLWMPFGRKKELTRSPSLQGILCGLWHEVPTAVLQGDSLGSAAWRGQIAHSASTSSRIIQLFFFPDVLLPHLLDLMSLALHISCQTSGCPSCWSAEQQLKYKPTNLRTYISLSVVNQGDAMFNHAGVS